MPLEHPQVMMPPPALYLGGLLMGYGIDQALTLPAPAFPGDRWAILFCSGGSLTTGDVT